MCRKQEPRSPHPPIVSIALTLAGSLLATAAAADWPQWGGPHRDWHATPVELSETWPEQGPKVLWHHELGEGYSSFAVAEGVATTLFRRGDEEIAVAFEADSGRELWRHAWPEPGERFNDRFGLGPYATPAIHGGRVLVVGSGAEVRALSLDSGEVLWKRNLWREVAAPESPGLGYTPSPLIVEVETGPLAILPLGHAEGRGVVALRLEDGETAWTSGDDVGAHSSPIFAELAGEDHVIVVSKSEISGLDPESGRALWRLDHENSNGANILTPVLGDESFFVSSGPSKGSRMIKARRQGDGLELSETWQSPQLRIFYSNAVKVGDRLVGSNGGVGPATLNAVDFSTGKRLWRSREVGRANLIVTGRQGESATMIALEEKGTLFLLRIDGEGVDVLARHQLFPDRAWTPPVLVGHRLLVRDRHRAIALELP